MDSLVADVAHLHPVDHDALLGACHGEAGQSPVRGAVQPEAVTGIEAVCRDRAAGLVPEESGLVRIAVGGPVTVIGADAVALVRPRKAP
jgi:hypothetical protein